MATSGASFLQNYKNRLFWPKLISPDLATHRSRFHFLVFLCIRSRAFKMRRLALRDEECPWRGSAKRRPSNAPEGAKNLLYSVTFFLQMKVFGRVEKTSPDNSV